jgi:hypothetical protein
MQQNIKDTWPVNVIFHININQIEYTIFSFFSQTQSTTRRADTTLSKRITELFGVIAHLRVQWLISQLTKILLNYFKSSLNTLKYYLCDPYPDSATIFNTSVKTKCKQTNPRFLTNVGWFLKWIKERFYFESCRSRSLYLFLQNKLKFENILYLLI